MTRQQYRHDYYERTKGPLKGHHNLKKTHCPAGHAYTPENSYSHPITGGRACRVCNRERKQSKVESQACQ